MLEDSESSEECIDVMFWILSRARKLSILQKFFFFVSYIAPIIFYKTLKFFENRLPRFYF